jgi:DNA phosphorothioation-dependent restriction protein DptH
MATEFILWDLYDYASNQGKEERPLPIVLDEIQNLDHSLNAPLSKMLTEGRKFGISAILATQTLSNLPQEARDRLFMATHKLFFKPAETELKEYATILANITGDKLDIWKERLVKLNKGECYSIGPALNIRSEVIEERAYPITITSLLERIKRTENNG